MSAWVDFNAVKKAVSLEMVIHHYGIELRKVGAGTLRGKCPLPMHGEDHKNRASFTATLTKGVGGVWACQSTSCIKARDGKKGGNALDLVATMEGCSIRDAAVKLAEWFRVQSGPAPERGPASNTKSEMPAELVSKEKKEGREEGNKPLTFTLQGIDHAHPYVVGRGITTETAKRFGVGVFGGKGTMQGRCVIQIHNGKGELLAYAGRAIDESEPKYKFPAGFQKSAELYNLHRAVDLNKVGGTGTVVVVEGFFGCIKVHEAEYPCVALMGSSLGEKQGNDLAEYFTSVVLMFDGDEAGRQATDECIVKLARRGLWVKAVFLGEGKQPDMLSSEEIWNLVEG
jgi:DNA primase